jgi:hypothetical protein
MALDNPVIPGFLKMVGYVPGAFGKWHLGEKIELSPLKRGFDEFYGFLGRGGHSYFNFDPDSVEKFGGPIYRGLEALQNEEGYLTDLLTDEAVAFIQRNKEVPFFVIWPIMRFIIPSKRRKGRPINIDKPRRLIRNIKGLPKAPSAPIWPCWNIWIAEWGGCWKPIKKRELRIIP